MIAKDPMFLDDFRSVVHMDSAVPWSVAARGFVRQHLPAARRAAAHAQLDFCQVRIFSRFGRKFWGKHRSTQREIHSLFVWGLLCVLHNNYMYILIYLYTYVQ